MKCWNPHCFPEICPCWWFENMRPKTVCRALLWGSGSRLTQLEQLLHLLFSSGKMNDSDRLLLLRSFSLNRPPARCSKTLWPDSTSLLPIRVTIYGLTSVKRKPPLGSVGKSIISLGESVISSKLAGIDLQSIFICCLQTCSVLWLLR